MDLKAVKPISTQCNTNSHKQSTASPQQAKQTLLFKFTFKDLIRDLMLEQQEQM